VASPHFAACPTAAHLYHLLEQLAGALDTSVPYPKGINPFFNPLVFNGGDAKGCMVYDHRRVHSGMAMDINKEGKQPQPRYLRLCLGKDSEGRQQMESAHRVVLLATSGPPPVIHDAA
jgi:hypothetical protein